ncbi:MAG: hypothetical protein ACK5TR_00425 [Alphaproteobacteria bacterium]|jgi:hypothetical protein|nr:hypothetical protein [Alphaproteobacteria bacterium]
MMKRVFSGLLAALSASTALAGNFYNADGGIDDLKSGETLNRRHHMGLADNAYATLISKRLVVRATHGTLEAPIDDRFNTGDKVKFCDDVLTFYGKDYHVTRWIERADAGLGATDICIGVLDRDVEEEVSPIAVHAGDVENVFVHSLARHIFLHTSGQGPFPNFFETQNYGSTLYGRAFIPKMYDPRHPGAGNLSVNRPDGRMGPQYDPLADPDQKAKDLFNPIGGDSSSPCYVKVDGEDEYALIGLLSQVGDHGHGGTYTDVGYNLPWLRDWERRLIEAGVFDDPGEDGKIKTVSEDHWVTNPDSIYDELEKGFVNLRSRVPHGFNAAIYLSEHEDLRRAFSTTGLNRRPTTLNEALKMAKRHYADNGARENRHTTEQVRIGQHPEAGVAPEDFDPLLYIGLNPGAKARLGNRSLTDVINGLALQDYLAHGGVYRTFLSEEEAGTVPQNFNAFAYLALNADLVRAYGQQTLPLAIETAKRHYIDHGRMERRPYTEAELLRRTSGQFHHLGLPVDFHPATYLSRDEAARQALQNVTLEHVFDRALDNVSLPGVIGDFADLNISGSAGPASSSDGDQGGGLSREDQHRLRQWFEEQDSSSSSDDEGGYSSSSSDDDEEIRIVGGPYQGGGYSQGQDSSEEDSDDRLSTGFHDRIRGIDGPDSDLAEAVFDDFGVPLDFNPFVYLMLYPDLMAEFGRLPVGQMVDAARNHYAAAGFEDHPGFQEELLRRRIRDMPQDTREQVRARREAAERFKGAMKLTRVLRYAERFETLTMEEAFEKARNLEPHFQQDRPLPQPPKTPIVLDERGIPADFNPMAYGFLNPQIQDDINKMRKNALLKEVDEDPTFQEFIDLAKNHYAARGGVEKLPYRADDVKHILRVEHEKKLRENPRDAADLARDQRVLDAVLPAMERMMNDPYLMAQCAHLPMRLVLNAALQHSLGNPLDFDPREYRRLNPDLENVLQDMDEIEISRHYHDVGRDAGRPYREGPYVFGLPRDFNPAQYRHLNQDLVQVYGDDLQAYADHFRNHGIKERRPYKEGLNLAGLPGDFDPEAYRHLNPGLQEALGDDPQAYADHYFAHGKNEGRLYKLNLTGVPVDFDVREYLRLYPDLQAAYGNNLQGAVDHYRTSGQNEGRIYKIDFEDLPEDFDARLYVRLNPDIIPQLDDDDYMAREKHFLLYGQKANRPYKLDFEGVPQDFDIDEYFRLYPDVKKAYQENPQGAINHYRENGRNEGRIYQVNYDEVPADFDDVVYEVLHPDIAQLIQENGLYAREHYLAYGKREGKAYRVDLNDVPDDFDGFDYMDINPDLPETVRSPFAARVHYAAHGRAEGRVYKLNLEGVPHDFDVKEYLRLYPDVEEAVKGNLQAAINHYRENGRNEDRIYQLNYDELPDDFDEAAYEILNPDITRFTMDHNITVEEHYLAYGRREGKAYRINLDNVPDDFDAYRYERLNPDVRDTLPAFIRNAGLLHYAAHGQAQGRVYKVDMADLPADFDAEAYLRLNPDFAEQIRDQFANPETHYLAQGRRLNLKYKDAEAQPAQPGGALGGDEEADELDDFGLPRGFNAGVYLALNPNLMQHFIDGNYTVEQMLGELPGHYLDFGANEHRPHKARELLRQMQERHFYQDLPQDFHPAFYLMRNQQLLMNVVRDVPVADLFEELANHYRNVGRPMGLLY